MKRIAILITAVLLVSTLQAQKDTSWTFKGVSSLSFTQVALSNWSAGGESSLSLTALGSYSANYAKGVHLWENSLEVGYGSLKQGDADFIKTDDKIDLTSKYGRQAWNEHWYYTALANFKSQFAPGFNYPNDSVRISEFMAPGYVLASMGFDYKPNDIFSVYISPVTAKFTFVMDQTLADAGAFGVDAAEFNALGEKTADGKNIRSEFGGYLRAKFQKDIMENVNLQSRLELFSNYVENPQNIDVLWETILAMKVNKYIAVNITTTLLYDDDIDIEIDSNDDGVVDKLGPRTQFKEVLGIGFSYQF